MQSPLVQLSNPSKKHPFKKELQVSFEVYGNVLYGFAYEHEPIATQNVVGSVTVFTYVHY